MVHAPSAPFVAPLQSIAGGDLAAVGGKAANLGELMRAGLPVPAGFAVTTDAYALAAAQAGITALLADPGTAPSTLRDALEAVTVPERIREEITDAYRDLGADAPVAVRSSATAEDLPGAAFAGQQDTYLGIRGADAVVDAVRRCWASLWTDRAVAYRRDRRIDPAEVRIAVVVQSLVDADLAGIMLTADPVSGDRDRLVIDAGAGLGEAVVSGLVTPDHYVLDHGGRLREWTPGRGEVVIRAEAGGGVRQERADAAAGRGAVPADGADPVGRRRAAEATAGTAAQPLLDRRELSELAGHARTIAAHLGRPQDIEWAIADGRAWILQARPMTALPPDTPPLSRIQRLQAAILTEYLPIRPYPLDVTTQVAHGPADMMREIAEHYGIAGAFADYLREEDGVAVQIVPPSPRPTLRTAAALPTVLRAIRRFRPARWMEDPRQRAFLREVEELEALDLASLSWPELLRVPPRALGVQDHCRDLRIDYLPGAGAAMVGAVVPVTLLGRRSLLPDLLGGVRTRTEDSADALARLADQVRDDPALRELLEGREGAEALTALAQDEHFAGFRAALDAYLSEFGRRETVSPLLVSPPTIAESPEVVLGLVLSRTRRPTAEGEEVSRSRAALETLLDHPLLRGREVLQEAMRRRVQAAREGVAFREDTHFFFTAPLPTLRRCLLEIARRLHSAGLLEETAQVWHLRWEEIAAITDPASLGAREADALRGRARQRAEKREGLAGVPMIDPRAVFPETTADAAGDGAEVLAAGTPAGSGTATGIARLIRGAEDFDRLGDGEVLVCPYTNPAWTPLFRRAGAVVVDTGSAASHAAIVAREYGLPAVMGTGSGTRSIADGQVVTVDGARGRVIAATDLPEAPA